MIKQKKSGRARQKPYNFARMEIDFQLNMIMTDDNGDNNDDEMISVKIRVKKFC